MKLPVYIYNDKVLSQVGETVDKDYPNLNQLISDMFETMIGASGIGLTAHQIGIPLRLFVIDITCYKEGDESLEGFKKVFINSEIIEEEGEEVEIKEGCLSLPGLHLEIKRKSKVKLKYLDENFVEHEEWFEGLAARCIQHEHDHTNGVLFVKRVPELRRRLIQSKLQKIVKRNFSTNYKYKI
jgi:peptide deformylase